MANQITPNNHRASGWQASKPNKECKIMAEVLAMVKIFFLSNPIVKIKKKTLINNPNVAWLG